MAGSWTTFGDVRVLALEDAVVVYPWPLAEAFPGVQDAEWEPFRARFPDAFAGPDRLRSTYRCYLLRTLEQTILVDTGMGPDGSPLSAVFGHGGRLMDALADAHVDPGDIDIVLLTHLHPDHVGGNLSDGRLAFPRARYVAPRTDWDWCHLPETQAHFPFAYVEQDLTPLEALGALELVDGEHALTEELTILPSPGHTPGHTIVEINSRGEQVLLVADALLHPAQITEPHWYVMVDADPEQDRRSREALLDRLEAERLVFSASHFPDPVFGRVVREGSKRFWQPLISA
jgi:glyoxylase-like metal-dependent hydrolase (beta-lactamase superfamily II)